LTVVVETDEFTIEVLERKSVGNSFVEKRYLCVECGQFTKKMKKSVRCVFCQQKYAASKSRKSNRK
jgi:hypothetical protein